MTLVVGENPYLAAIEDAGSAISISFTTNNSRRTHPKARMRCVKIDTDDRAVVVRVLDMVLILIGGEDRW